MMLQLPQAYPFCYVELWERTRQGTRLLIEARFDGNFAEASDVINAVWDWLRHTADRYDPSYTKIFWRPSPANGWQELAARSAIAEHLSDTYMVQLTSVAFVEEKQMPVPQFIQQKDDILRGLEGKIDSPRVSLPDGDDFLRAVLAGDYVVDKTAFLPALLEKKWTFFLRPRRFGKSFWVSTLKNFFSGATELFANFNVWSQQIALGRFVWNPSNPQEHNFPPIPVVRLDFSRYVGVENAADANRELLVYLNQLAAEEGIGPIGSFPQFISALAFHPRNEWRQVVLLIDEYDALLTANLDHERHATFESLREHFVKKIFTQLKSVDEHILFCFVTGISAFGQTSIWSAGTQFTDYSLDERLAAMCGFTHDEARTLVQRADIVVRDRLEEFWQVLVDRYDGYRFHTSGDPVPIFNPFLIRRVVEKGRFVDGWAATASESVFKYIRRKVLPSLPFELPMSTLEQADGSPELDGNVKVVKMLFRAGYLTIGEVSGDYVKLVHVNTETTVALVKDYLRLEFQTNTGGVLLHRLRDLLVNKQFIEFFHEMNRQVFLSIAEKASIGEAGTERHYQNLVYGYASMCLENTQIKCHLEVASAIGYADLIFAYPDVVVVIELKALRADGIGRVWESKKLTPDAKQTQLLARYQQTAAEAHHQIHQKAYLFTPVATNYEAHQKIRVVLVADSKMRQLAYADIRAPAGPSDSAILIEGWAELLGALDAVTGAGLEAEEDGEVGMLLHQDEQSTHP